MWPEEIVEEDTAAVSTMDPLAGSTRRPDEDLSATVSADTLMSKSTDESRRVAREADATGEAPVADAGLREEWESMTPAEQVRQR